jgi:hypothetical protein
MANSVQYANEPTIASLLELHKREVMSQTNCHQVGEIVSFDAGKQTAEVKIKMLKMINGELKSYPIIVDCPCVVLCGGEGRITFPIRQGDGCLVLFNDKDLDNWYASGQEMAPRTDRAHSFTDAMAIVGVHNLQNCFSDYLTSGTELKYGSSTIKLEENKVTITDGSASVVLSNGQVTITATNVTVTSPTVAFSGAVAIAGATTIAGGLTVQGKDIGPSHTHSGVRSGGDSTGGVN